MNEQSVGRRNFLRSATVGAAVTAATGSATAQTEEGGSGGGTTHTVDMTDQLVFDPESITIAPGDTIEWVNVGSVGHSVTAYEDDIPDGATYFASGDLESEQAARDAYSSQGDIPGGESYSHTFETLGTYEYFCIPHEQVGMVGTVEVVEGGASSGGEGGSRSLPEGAKELAVAVTGGIAAVLAIAFVLLKYGGDPDQSE